ncbi:unnamed protein product [Larinioides sclopetarius]|uniref:Uncharacterized protein n=1 Tax=Larinioides sclopetarius TaxID=280406 RepID=A0AAV1ZYB5_9ARAC
MPSSLICDIVIHRMLPYACSSTNKSANDFLATCLLFAQLRLETCWVNLIEKSVVVTLATAIVDHITMGTDAVSCLKKSGDYSQPCQWKLFATMPMEIIRNYANGNYSQLCQWKLFATVPMEIIRNCANGNYPQLCQWKLSTTVPMEIIHNRADGNYPQPVRVPRWRIGECLQWSPLVIEGKYNTFCGPTGRSPTLSRLWQSSSFIFPRTTITLADVKAVAKHRLLPHSFNKHLITDIDCPRILTSIITRLRTNHYKGMKILPDKTRTYIPCKNCTDAQFTPDRILECPALTPHILRLGVVPLVSELREVLYSTEVLQLAVAVFKTHEAI